MTTKNLVMTIFLFFSWIFQGSAEKNLDKYQVSHCSQNAPQTIWFGDDVVLLIDHC
jgi:hypothetical protein